MIIIGVYLLPFSVIYLKSLQIVRLHLQMDIHHVLYTPDKIKSPPPLSVYVHIHLYTVQGADDKLGQIIWKHSNQ